MDAAPGVARGSAEEVRVSGRRANEGASELHYGGAPPLAGSAGADDAVQAQHAALGDRASPIAVRLKTSPSRGSFEHARYRGRAIQLPVRVSLEIGPAAH